MDRLLTAEDIADRLGVKTQWVWAQARAGRIPQVRLGRYCRFRESAIEAWVSAADAVSCEIGEYGVSGAGQADSCILVGR